MRLFYDHLVDKSKLLEIVHTKAQDENEKKKLFKTIDEIVYHAVLDVILVHLDEKHHEEFLTLVHKTPHSEQILIYIKQKTQPDIEDKIRTEMKLLIAKIATELHT